MQLTTIWIRATLPVPLAIMAAQRQLDLLHVNVPSISASALMVAVEVAISFPAFPLLHVWLTHTGMEATADPA